MWELRLNTVPEHIEARAHWQYVRGAQKEHNTLSFAQATHAGKFIKLLKTGYLCPAKEDNNCSHNKIDLINCLTNITSANNVKFFLHQNSIEFSCEQCYKVAIR